MKRRHWLGAAAAASCTPTFGPSDSTVDRERVLAIRAMPAEAQPGAPVTFRSLVGTPDGTLVAAGVWSFCVTPKPPTVDNAVASECLSSGPLLAAGAGLSIAAPIPLDACSLFGPDTPVGGIRPRDPDATGGYYQPLRLDVPGAETAFALARIRCDLAGASASTAEVFAGAYRINNNPVLLPLTAATDGSVADLTSVAAGARVVLTASWPPESVESYAYFDPASDGITNRREAMSVAWYATAGAFDYEATGRAEGDPSTTTENAWTAPARVGPAHLWTVLRDSRGGVDFASYDIRVR